MLDSKLNYYFKAYLSRNLSSLRGQQPSSLEGSGESKFCIGVGLPDDAGAACSCSDPVEV